MLIHTPWLLTKRQYSQSHFTRISYTAEAVWFGIRLPHKKYSSLPHPIGLHLCETRDVQCLDQRLQDHAIPYKCITALCSISLCTTIQLFYYLYIMIHISLLPRNSENTKMHITKEKIILMSSYYTPNTLHQNDRIHDALQVIKKCLAMQITKKTLTPVIKCNNMVIHSSKFII